MTSTARDADRTGAADAPDPARTAMINALTSTVTSSGEPVTTSEPGTGRPLATVPQCTPKDVSAAFAAARAAQVEWAATPVRERVAPLATLHDLLLTEQRQILDIIQWETGKARKHAFEEVLEVAMNAQYLARNAPRVLRPTRRAGALPGLTRTVETRKPKGVVCVITPWNYPLALTADVFPALAAGNAVVQKPDTQTALTALWTRELLVRAGLPRGVWQIVLGDPAVIGDTLVDGADFVAFTGSTAAGRRIAERAGGRLIGCSLELGGKNPMVVLADADVAAAAHGAVRACFANAGQLCISIERLYVHKKVHDRFTEELVRRVGALKLGTGTDFGVDVGSLTSGRQLDTVTRHVEDARAKGATVLTGGRPRPDIGPFVYEPTVLAGVTSDMLAHRRETFGPVVSVYRVESDDDAVAAANDSEYGLNASVWSTDVRHARAVADRIRTGTVNINEGYGATYGSQAAPMGGMKSSGLGRRHGDEGLLKLTDAQTVASQHLLGFDPPPGITARQHAALLTAGLRLLKKLRIR
jgi:succinate-semialdehyde dehydrogenase / glutarate-semialdehyde dehydrogenase